MLTNRPQTIYLARHGETAWSLTGQHTGLSDLPLTPRGECNAQRLGSRLQGMEFASIFTSPLQRASRTCQLAGFGSQAEVDPDLVEWNYGAYEGMRTVEIQAAHPGWELFRDGVPDGESMAEVAARAGRVINRLRAIEGDVLLFSSAHFLRVLAPRWIGLPGEMGRHLLLGTASLSTLTHEHNYPAIGLWNDTRHVSDRCGEESK